MNARLYYTTDATPIEPIEELSRVTLLKSVEISPVGYLPEGSSGTVVSVYGAGEAYLVEFTNPFSTLITVENADIKPIAGASRDEYIAASDEISNRKA